MKCRPFRGASVDLHVPVMQVNEKLFKQRVMVTAAENEQRVYEITMTQVSAPLRLAFISMPLSTPA